MILVADIGNSSISAGIFDQNKLIKKYRYPSDANLGVQDYYNLFMGEISQYDITDCVIGSVGQESVNFAVKEAVDKIFNIDSKILSADGLKFNFNPVTDNLEGIDRLANISEAIENYSLPLIVIDAGTATTFDVADSEKKFIGGVIMPGVGMQLRALNEFTSKLPKISPTEIENVVQKETDKAMLSGVIIGHAGAIEKLIKDCYIELGKKPSVIGTGGFINLVSHYINESFVIDNDLTLKGLKRIYDLNKSD